MCLMINEAVFLAPHEYRQTSVSGAVRYRTGAYGRDCTGTFSLKNTKMPA
jgi:hypothetical protein